jgi:hypothetical protein
MGWKPGKQIRWINLEPFENISVKRIKDYFKKRKITLNFKE